MSSSNGLPSWITRGLRQAQVSSLAAPGSIAARASPMQYGSLAARRVPGLFDPMTVQADQEQQRRDKLLQDNQNQFDQFNLAQNSGLHRARIDQTLADQAYAQPQRVALGLRNPLKRRLPPGQVPDGMLPGIQNFYTDPDDGN